MYYYYPYDNLYYPYPYESANEYESMYRNFPPPPPPPGGQMGGMGSGAPTAPPPSFTPSKQSAKGGPGGPQLYAVDPGAIRPCTRRYVYIWLDNGRSFWAWLTFVGRRSVSGYRWVGRRWVYFGIDLNRIESFQCF